MFEKSYLYAYKKKKYLENILIFIPCPASPSLYTETRMILLKTQASIKIFHGKKGWRDQYKASKTKYRQVPKWAVQENCTFYFIVRVEIFIIQRFKVIKPKSARSFLKTLQWLPHRIVNITESFRLKGLLTVFLNSGWIKNTQPPPPQSTDGQPSFHSDSHVVAGERTTTGPAPPVFCSRHTGPPRASRTCQALPTPQGFCLKYFSPSDLSSIFLCLLQVFPHVTFSVIVRLLLVALYKNCSLSSPFPGLYIYFPSFTLPHGPSNIWHVKCIFLFIVPLP